MGLKLKRKWYKKGKEERVFSSSVINCVTNCNQSRNCSKIIDGVGDGSTAEESHKNHMIPCIFGGNVF